METENGVKEHLIQGFLHHANGDFDQEIAACTQAVQLDPDDADLYVFRGSAYMSKGDYDMAIADIETALRLDPDNDKVKHLKEIILCQ
jgi:Flp pilus assembly protein TadD